MTHRPHFLALVEDWIRLQPLGTPILAVVVAHDLRKHGVRATDVSSALLELARSGKVKRALAVRAPDGTVLRRVYKNSAEIECVLYGRFGDPFSRDDADVIPAFESVESS